MKIKDLFSGVVSEDQKDPSDLSRWLHGKEPAEKDASALEGASETTGSFAENKPIEPGKSKSNRLTLIKLLLFLIFIIYIILSQYRIPILTGIGGYLVIEHPLEKADLVVCMMGKPIERGLKTAQVLQDGLASRVFFARESLPDGYSILAAQNIHPPETRDRLTMILKGLDIPPDACMTDDRFTNSTFDEALVVKEIVRKNNYRSLIIVTSPTHCRRAWLTFREVFKGEEKIKIMMAPSEYSSFNVNNWWKKKGWFQEIIVEYQKLLYYTIKYLL